MIMNFYNNFRFKCGRIPALPPRARAAASQDALPRFTVARRPRRARAAGGRPMDAGDRFETLEIKAAYQEESLAKLNGEV